MIPPLSRRTGYLPRGIHVCTWEEFAQRFGFNEQRKEQLAGLLAMLANFRQAGCESVLIDGSFVTAKPLPGDYDGAWDPTGVDWEALDPVLLDFTDHRAAMKGKYLGEVFPWNAQAAPGEPFTEFFQHDRDGRAKGIIRIFLRDLP